MLGVKEYPRGKQRFSAEVLSWKRIENYNEQTLNNCFEIYKTALEDSGILEADDASVRIFNTDKTEMGTNPNQRKLFFKRGAKMLIF